MKRFATISLVVLLAPILSATACWVLHDVDAKEYEALPLLAYVSSSVETNGHTSVWFRVYIREAPPLQTNLEINVRIRDTERRDIFFGQLGYDNRRRHGQAFVNFSVDAAHLGNSHLQILSRREDKMKTEDGVAIHYHIDDYKISLGDLRNWNNDFDLKKHNESWPHDDNEPDRRLVDFSKKEYGSPTKESTPTQ